ncbi:MAG: cysteine hydrolase family protein [Bacteroidota bacterium]|nr:cysteine hydrolase family protein [Bacteroidota bacterium]
MKKILSLFLITFSIVLYSAAQNKSTALLLIDIQNFYFPGGKAALVEPEKAAENAARLLAEFRKENLPVIHVKHNSEPGGEINKMVSPVSGEKIFSKNAVNCFVGTDLLDYLKSMKIDTLVICGMQTHMCVEAAVRAGTDLGFKCILIGDACATRDLKYGDKVIKAEDVHYSTLSTFKSYATVETTEEFLAKWK